jgi:hypothetical protein
MYRGMCGIVPRQPISIFLSRRDRDSARVTLTVLAGRRDREIGIASERSTRALFLGR